MSQLSSNLTARRKELGMTVEDVQVAVNRLGFPVAYSTVAGWLNGSREVGKMDHLVALCAALQTDLDSMAKGEIAVAEGKVETAVVRALRDLDPAQQEILLALAKSMKPGRGPT